MQKLNNVFLAITGPDDIPKKGNPEVFGQILFAKDKVEYHGQPLGLIVAKSQVGHLPHCTILLLLSTVIVTTCHIAIAL